MKINIIAIILIPLIIIMHTFISKPFLEKRDATKLTTKILTLWKNDDIAKIYDLWINPEETPPLYDVKSYNIINTIFYKEKKSKICETTLTLDFSENNIMESNKTWKLILIKTKRGWMAKELRQLN